MNRLAITLLILLSACSSQMLAPAAVYDLVECADGTIAPAHLCPQRTIRLPAQIQQVHEVAYITAPAATVHIEEVNVKETKETPMPTETIMQRLLDKAPSAYWFNDGQYTIYASNEMRSTGEWKEHPFTLPGLLYWNVSSNQTFLYLSDIPDRWWQRHKYHIDAPRNSYEVESDPMNYQAGLFQLNLDRNKLLDFARIPTQLHRYFTGLADWATPGLYFAFYVESPIEWMQRYSNEQPLAIDITERDLPTPGGAIKSSLSIHYTSVERPHMEFVPHQNSYILSKEVPSQVIFRFDNKNIPAVIDEVTEDGMLLRRHTYQLEDTHTYNGQQNSPVSAHIAQLPQHVILTLNDYDIWLESLER